MLQLSNNNLLRKGRGLLQTAAVLAASCTLAISAHAAGTASYDDGGGGNNWSTANNWVGDAVPNAFDFATPTSIEFADDPGTGASEAVTDDAGFVNFGSITFSDNDYTITSSGMGAINFQLHSGISVTDATDQVFAGARPLALQASQNFNVTDAGGSLAMGWSISGNGNTLSLNNGGAANGTISISGVIANASLDIVNSQGGYVALTGNNSYSGGTTLSGGTLEVGNSNALGSGNVVIDAAATLTPTAAGSFTLGNDISLEADITFGQPASAGNLTLAGDVTIDANRTFTVNNTNGTTTISGAILDDAGSYGITKAGTGALVIANAHNSGNVYEGATTIAAGTLQLGGSGALPGSTDLFLAASATFNLNGNNQTVGTFTGGGNVDLGAGVLTISGGGDYTGVIAGTGGLVKTGSNTLAISSTNTYSGTNTFAAGTVVIDDADALGDSGGTSTTVIENGAVLALNDSTGLDIDNENFDIAGTGVSNSGAIAVLDGANTLGGAVALTADSSIAINTGDSLALDGVVSGAFNLTKTGAGTLSLNATNTYSGTTTVSAGYVELNAANALAAGSGLSLNGSATVDMNGNNITLGTLAGSGTIVMGAGSLTFGSGGASGSFDGDISGTGNLTKVGAGTSTLNASIDTTGTFSVEGGTIDFEGGTVTNVSAMDIQSGAEVVFSASNVFTGGAVDLTLNGGTITFADDVPASTVISFGTLTLTENSIIDFGGSVNGVTLSFTDSSAESWTAGKVLSIYNWSGELAAGDGIDQLIFGTDADGLTELQQNGTSILIYSDAGTSLLTQANSQRLLGDGELVPVPEPGTYMFGGLLAAGALAQRIRRKRKAKAITKSA